MQRSWGSTRRHESHWKHTKFKTHLFILENRWLNMAFHDLDHGFLTSTKRLLNMGFGIEGLDPCKFCVLLYKQMLAIYCLLIQPEIDGTSMAELDILLILHKCYTSIRIWTWIYQQESLQILLRDFFYCLDNARGISLKNLTS